MKVRIYYFTGSGNTLMAAEGVKKAFEDHQLHCEILSMDEGGDVNLQGIDYLGLMFPVAIQSTYPMVWDFINRLPKSDKLKVFMIDTMQAFSGGIVGPVKKVLVKKGYDCVGALELKMSSSINSKNTDIEALNRKNRVAVLKAQSFVDDLLKGQTAWRRVPLLSDWMRSISTKRSIWDTTSKRLSINDDECVGCLLCVKGCPVQALHWKHEAIEIDHSTCISCVRCAHTCPKDAFRWNDKKLIRLKRE